MTNTCFVPNCDNGQKKVVAEQKAAGKKPPSMFRAPKGQLEIWRRKIPRKDKLLTQSDWVCINHFAPDDVETHWHHVGPDGKVIKIEKERPTLKPSAVPVQFQEEGTPKYLSKPVKRRKAPVDRSKLIPEKKARVYHERKSSQWEDVSQSASFSDQEPDDVEMVSCAEHTQQVPLGEETASEKEENKNTNEGFYNVKANATLIKKPSTMWAVHIADDDVVFSHVDINDVRSFDKCIIFRGNSTKAYIRGKEIPLQIEIKEQSDVENVLNKVHKMKICKGADFNNFSKECEGCLPEANKFGPKSIRCLPCRHHRENLLRKKKREEAKIQSAPKMTPLAKRSQQRRRLLKKVQSLEENLNNIMNKCKKMEVTKIQEITQHLPLKQQEAIMTCMKAAKAKSPAGMRYNVEWVYECILLRIKGPKLYKSMMKNQLLPLPSVRTLQRYMAKLNPSFGFQDNVFSLLREKSEHLTEAEKHGSLLLDEMKLSEGLAFNKSSLKVDGLVDLGKHTPEQQEKEMGDHALVLMFQPFRGSWIQTVAAFCTKGAAKGEILEKIILEAIVLLENAGLKVDEIVTDGGSWNRAMWKLFGISEARPSCLHPNENNRRLYFASDFPHLMKTMWSRVRLNKVLKTPDGEVKLSHWERMVELDDTRQIKRNFFLTRDHIKPQYYQTMNVKMAFTFFSDKVAAAMMQYKNRNTPGFEDCLPTIHFIRKINAVADAMNSRLPWQALRADEESEAHKAITNFLDYLKTWKNTATLRERFTNQTHLGLVVTLKGTLDLIKYLSDDVGYNYLMTRRINQDALEHFFGIIRQACGSNPHPDPIQFIQLYRLLSTHSLIKPPKGSNVSGGEMLKTLLSLEDIIGSENKKQRAKLEKKIDEILDNGDFEIYDPYFEINTTRTDIDPPALMNFTGYVVRKAKKCSNAKDCSNCLDTLLASPDRQISDDEDLIHLRSHGYLFVPSDGLMEIVYRLETAILNILDKEEMHRNLIFEVVDEVSKMGINAKVGCPQHAKEVTKWTVNFYLQTRMIFASKLHMEKVQDHKKKEKLLRKQSKV